MVPGVDFSFKQSDFMELSKGENSLDLYIHIPFCLNHCFFCPYNTTPFDKGKVPLFFNSLKAEMKLLLRQNENIFFNSIYIGGGTPTLVSYELADFLNWLKERVQVKRHIALETNPNNIDEKEMATLRDAGATMLSIGIQSFNDKLLRALGRSYDSKDLRQKINLASDAGFELINIDLLWGFADQTLDEFNEDLDDAISSSADQITAYPLFKFPHSEYGAFNSIKRVVMPGIPARRKLYRHFHEKMLSQNFKRVSVWGFTKNSHSKFSSVTRLNHVGIGPGAASRIKNGFYFNTFNLEAYLDRIANGRQATSLRMEMNAKLEKIYDLYWKYYETEVPIELIDSIEDWFPKIATVFLTATSMQKKRNGMCVLTERGAFWVHLLQNHFILNYINKVWTISMRESFPKEIKL